MRFIGNKTKLLVNIYHAFKSHEGLVGDRFFDFFAGTASVGRHFKEAGFKVFSSDVLFFSYILQKAYIENNTEPKFTNLLKTVNTFQDNKLFQSDYEFVVDYLNRLEGVEGFIYKNYTEEGTAKNIYKRKFFMGDNGKKIDAIRIQIDRWKRKDLINDLEHAILLATLIESVPFYANISGVYAAFLKQYDPRAVKSLLLRPIRFSLNGPIGKAYNSDSMHLLDKIETDILYLDPPYNERQYAPNYHLLETIAKYDMPTIKGITGMRKYDDQKSDFCNPVLAITALKRVVESARYKVFALSYNSEGIMKQKDILGILSRVGEPKLVEVDYKRFKSNSRGILADKTHIKEQLYLLKR